VKLGPLAILSFSPLPPPSESLSKMVHSRSMIFAVFCSVFIKTWSKREENSLRCRISERVSTKPTISYSTQAGTLRASIESCELTVAKFETLIHVTVNFNDTSPWLMVESFLASFRLSQSDQLLARFGDLRWMDEMDWKGNLQWLIKTICLPFETN